ncbi:cellulose synthase-like protein G2 [Lolium rigidum]|uniref:cellulose synthase-like protein G2 n=1 Tax=Lolium rigidum TaxID=89674 RepID=UPI001F5D8975|nr:cellulose synthase-like protein G2 [Lolium rigidum]
MAAPWQDAAPLQLHTVEVDQPLAAVNRLLAGLHLALAAAAIARRGAHDIMLAADLVLLFLWLLSQAPMLRPVSRAAFPGRLSRPALPAVDVMVVTADPDKEPAVKVMNTVVSAMALDYPGGRLAVYLSDDAGSPLTLLAARRAYAFARAWVPFCRKYTVQCPCPEKFFSGNDDQIGGGDRHDELADDRIRVKNMYDKFKEGVEEAMNDAALSQTWTEAARQDHDAYVEIIADEPGGSNSDSDGFDGEDAMPSLVYVSREKRPAWPHHFKAGALNALLRVSSLTSNAPYVLVLDCDMYCNTRSSVLEAMCFHLDRRGRHADDLAFVQFPQMFHNVSGNDIYANELRSIFSTRWKGLDGLRGPILSGTGFCVKRDAVYGAQPASSQDQFSSMEVGELKARFGHSNGHLASLRRSWSAIARDALPEDATFVASCAYETGTKWGEEVGFLYQSVVEDYFTGYRQLYCRGWTSVYCYPAPSRPAPFLGSVPTNLNDVLVQNKRWMSGMLAVGLSRHCPLASALAVSMPQSMGFAYYAFMALYAFPVLCYATVPQLRFFCGTTSFPEASSLWFAAVFVSSLLQHLVEVSVAKRRLAVRTWWNEQRFWALNAVTGQLFACLSVALDLVGAGGQAVDFDLTSKASDDGGLYRDGVFDFSGCSTVLLPATTLCLLNDAALVGGIWKMVISGGWGDVSGELFLLCYIAAMSYPLLQGMFLRRDPARVPAWITAMSVGIAATLLSLFG